MPVRAAEGPLARRQSSVVLPPPSQRGRAWGGEFCRSNLLFVSSLPSLLSYRPFRFFVIPMKEGPLLRREPSSFAAANLRPSCVISTEAEKSLAVRQPSSFAAANLRTKGSLTRRDPSTTAAPARDDGEAATFRKPLATQASPSPVLPRSRRGSTTVACRQEILRLRLWMRGFVASGRER